MSYTLLLPRGCPEADARTVITSVSDAAVELGIVIVGGHTGWYDAVTLPIVGGVTVWGFAEQGDWISPGGAKEGDAILLSKAPLSKRQPCLAFFIASDYRVGCLMRS